MRQNLASYLFVTEGAELYSCHKFNEAFNNLFCPCGRACMSSQAFGAESGNPAVPAPESERSRISYMVVYLPGALDEVCKFGSAGGSTK